MKLGQPEVSLNVKDLDSSIRFYGALGFRQVEGNPEEGWVVVESEGLRVGLYQGHVPDNSISFFGGDVAGVTANLEEAGYEPIEGPCREDDGSTSAHFRDPDGNRIYLNT
jgi:catechol 2,3-dioxygenase-like lactoylglutathione lyase family enzyme